MYVKLAVLTPAIPRMRPIKARTVTKLRGLRGILSSMSLIKHAVVSLYSSNYKTSTFTTHICLRIPMYVSSRGAMPISSHTLLARVAPLELWSMDIKVDILPAIRRRENETAYRQILLPTLQPVRLQIRTAATRINGKTTSWRIAMPSFSSNLPIVVVKG